MAGTIGVGTIGDGISMESGAIVTGITIFAIAIGNTEMSPQSQPTCPKLQISLKPKTPAKTDTGRSLATAPWEARFARGPTMAQVA